MKIGIIGNYGATNVGDDTILYIMIKNLSDNDLVVFSSSPEETSRKFGVRSVALFPLGVRSILKNGFKKSIKEVKTLDAVVLGGGGLFQDNYLYACILWAWQVLWVKILKKPILIYGTGVGPLKGKLGKWITKWAYNQSEIIVVRDKYSKQLLHNIGINEQNIYTSSDIAFLFNTSEIQTDRTKNVFMISLRPWLNYNSKIVSVFTEFLLKIKQEKNADFIFTCMQEIKEKDHLVIDPIMKKVGGKLYVPKDFSELLQTMQSVEYAIGMRYHFLIATLLTQTPAIPISYAPKVDELFTDTPLEKYLIPISEISEDLLENILKRISVDYNNIKVYQKIRAHMLKNISEESMKSFNEFLCTYIGSGDFLGD